MVAGRQGRIPHTFFRFVRIVFDGCRQITFNNRKNISKATNDSIQICIQIMVLEDSLYVAVLQ